MYVSLFSQRCARSSAHSATVSCMAPCFAYIHVPRWSCNDRLTASMDQPVRGLSRRHTGQKQKNNSAVLLFASGGGIVLLINEEIAPMLLI
jgi:hypothetical protein